MRWQDRTELLEVLLRCRAGLKLPDASYLTTHYGHDSLVALLRFEDGKVYKLTLEEVKDDTPNSDTTK